MDRPQIEFIDVNIKVDNQLILKDVNFQIRKGELVYIFGANGSGKSTLIRSLIGLNSISSGKIRINSKENSQNNVSKLIGYVPQYSTIERDFPISVEEMIKLECRNSSQCNIGTHGHLKLLHSDHLTKRRISDLSGGEFQKVLIARALTSDPEILILDEPINNLDEKSQKNLLNFLSQINKESGKTIIIISHDHNIIRHDDIESRILFIVDKHVSIMTEHELLHSGYLEAEHFK